MVENAPYRYQRRTQDDLLRSYARTDRAVSYVYRRDAVQAGLVRQYRRSGVEYRYQRPETSG